MKYNHVNHDLFLILLLLLLLFSFSLCEIKFQENDKLKRAGPMFPIYKSFPSGLNRLVNSSNALVSMNVK